MEERARLLGGVFRITSEPQGGTTVELTVPMLLPDWLPAVTGSAAETAAEVVSSDAPVEAFDDLPVPEANRPPEALPSLTTATDAGRSST
jgi:hypothetical protein